MSVATLRPNTTIVNAEPVIGAASAHAALSDDSDATYVTHDIFHPVTEVGFTTVVPPSGAVVVGALVRLRQKIGAGSKNTRRWFVTLRDSGGTIAEWTVYGPEGSTIVLPTPSFERAFSQAAIDSFQVKFAGQAGGSGGQVNTLYEAYLDVTYVAKPVVVVNAPTGTLTMTNRPVVSWTPTLDPDGGPQHIGRIKIFSQAQYSIGGFDPVTSPNTEEVDQAGASTSRQAGVPLADGVYRAYVRTSQLVNGSEHLSDYAYSQFTINVALPAVPSISAIADDANARNTVTITGNTGAVTTNALEVERSTDAGATWNPVRHADGLDVRIEGSSATVHDYETANGQATIYRARAIHDFDPELSSTSAWSASTAATSWVSGSAWIKHPNQPSLNLAVTLAQAGGYGPVSQQARVASFQGLGSRLPVTISDTPLGERGSIVIRRDSTPDLDALRTLWQTAGTFLLQVPPSWGERDRYVVFGDLEASRLVSSALFHMRDVPLAWTEVQSPGGAQS